jgi:GNAT superfamily N-acetyltransferase
MPGSNSLGCQRGRVAVGRLEAGDRDAVLEVFDGLSERSRRLRYHGPKPRLPEREVDDLVRIGCCGREAVAAVDLVSGEVVGLARFVREEAEPRSAEVAFEVVDRCQGHGVGRRLLAELRALAALEGIESLKAYVVVGNEPALALLRGLGRVVRSSYEDGAYELVIDLEPLADAA